MDVLIDPQVLADSVGALRHFIGRAQLKTIAENVRGEEGAFFYEKLTELSTLVQIMPKTYETEGEGRSATVYLHYFAGSRANWYITERDKAPGAQHQAFGRADLFGDGGELGYISIEEIIRNGGELDLYWDPKPLENLKR